MKELIRLIYRFHFFLLFLILEIFSISFLINSSVYHGSKYSNSSNYFIGSIYDSYNDIISYLSLKDQNENLIRENEFLRNKTYYDSSKIGSEIDTSIIKRFDYISAEVINNSIYKENNFITLNIGMGDGVTPEMAVVSTDGVVGITRYVSENFSTVISVLNKKLKVSTKIKKNGFFGSLEWSGNNYLKATLNEIPGHVDIAIGDTLITSGYSAIFPEGINIGIIESFKKNPGDNFYSITVDLLVDYKMLSDVYIIKNLFQIEQHELEEKTIND